MDNQETWPSWWQWELELTPHLLKRMEDRDFNEIELRTMLLHAKGFRPDVVTGRWIIDCRHRRKHWEVIVEPDELDHVLVVVTAYAVTR
jgi:hypothetical protein